jgi:AhpD family alkylhydroperoxidase
LFNWSDYMPAVKNAFGKLAKAHPKMITAYQALGSAAANGGPLDARTRELIAVAVAVTLRCDGCIGSHAEAARNAGATEEELAQALAVAVQVNAGASYVYSMRALEAFEQTAPAA